MYRVRGFVQLTPPAVICAQWTALPVARCTSTGEGHKQVCAVCNVVADVLCLFATCRFTQIASSQRPGAISLWRCMVQQRLRRLWQRCLQQRRCLASVEGAACLFVWCAHINSFSCTFSRWLHWLARSAETGTSVAFPMVWLTPCPDGLDGVIIMLDGCTQCLLGALIKAQWLYP